MPSPEGSNLRPLWRFRHTFNKQKVIQRDGSIKKMLINDVGSRKVYENKGNHDKMPHENSDICVQLKPVLQKIADLEGQFAAIGAFRGCLVRKLTATSALPLADGADIAFYVSDR